MNYKIEISVLYKGVAVGYINSEVTGTYLEVFEEVNRLVEKNKSNNPNITLAFAVTINTILTDLIK